MNLMTLYFLEWVLLPFIGLLAVGTLIVHIKDAIFGEPKP